MLEGWKPLPIRAAIGESWFPMVSCGGNRGPLVGQLVRIKVSTVPASRTLDTNEYKISEEAFKWVKHVLEMKDPLPNEAQLTFDVSNFPAGDENTLDSAFFAVVTALISYLIQRAPSQPIVCSGAYSVTRKSVTKIGFVDEKSRIIESELAAAQVSTGCWIVEKNANDETVDCWLRDILGADYEDALLQACQRNTKQMVYQAVKDYQRYPKYSVALLVAAKKTNPPLEGNDLAVANWLLGVQEMHKGRSREAIELIEKAAGAWDQTDAMGRYPKRFLWQWLVSLSGIAWLDNGFISRALKQLEQAIQTMDGLPNQCHDVRRTKTQLLGSYRRVLQASGNEQRALRKWEEWVTKELGGDPEEARSLGDLAVMKWTLGLEKDAETTFKMATKALQFSSDEDRVLNRRFLEVHAMRMGTKEPSNTDPPASGFQQTDVFEAVAFFAKSDDFSPMIDWFNRFICEEDNQKERAGSFIAYRLVMLRGIADHLHIHNCPPTQTLRTFIEKSISILEEGGRDATAIVEALGKLRDGDPKAFRTIAPY